MDNKATRKLIEVMLIALSIYSLVTILWNLLSFILSDFINYELIPFARIPLTLIGIGYLLIIARKKRNLNLIYLSIATVLLFITSESAIFWGYKPIFCGNNLIEERESLLATYLFNKEIVFWIEKGLFLLTLLVLGFRFNKTND